MKRNTFVSTCFFVVCLSLVSCASKKLPEQNKTAQKEVELDEKALQELKKIELDKLNIEVDKLVSQALNGNSESKKYLANELYLKASASIMEGDYQSANILFAHLIRLEPEDTFLKKRFAISLIRMGELDKSISVLEDLRRQDKDQKINISLILAGVYGTLGQTEKALSIYKNILSQDPSNEDACVFYSKALASDKKIKDAIKLLEKCSKKNKGKGIFDYYIGKLYVDQGSLEQAKNSFKSSYKKEPTFSQAVMALGLIYEELSEQKTALNLYKKHLKKQPDDVTILSRVVQLLFNLKQFHEVIPYAERLSDSDPDNLNLKVKLGILYTEKKDYRKAVSTFKELLLHTPDNDNILYYVGAIYQELGMFDNAVTYYLRISDGSNLYEDSSMQVAKMLAAQSEQEYSSNGQLGNYGKLFSDHVEKMTLKIPKSKLEYKTLEAGLYESIGDFDKAINALNQVQKVEGFTDSYTFYLASLYEKKENYEMSNRIILDLLSEDPKNAHAWNYLGYSLLERGLRLDLAHEYILKALTLEPHDGYIRDSLGWYYFKVGKLQNALNELLYASKHVGNDYSVQKHLTIVYASMQDFRQAKKWAAKAMENTSSKEELTELKSLIEDIDQNRIPASH